MPNTDYDIEDFVAETILEALDKAAELRDFSVRHAMIEIMASIAEDTPDYKTDSKFAKDVGKALSRVLGEYRQ